LHFSNLILKLLIFQHSYLKEAYTSCFTILDLISFNVRCLIIRSNKTFFFFLTISSIQSFIYIYIYLVNPSFKFVWNQKGIRIFKNLTKQTCLFCMISPKQSKILFWNTCNLIIRITPVVQLSSFFVITMFIYLWRFTAISPLSLTE
jgi:hypothetical protein